MKLGSPTSGMPGEVADHANFSDIIHHSPEGHRGGGFGFKPFRNATSGYPNPMSGGKMARIGGIPGLGEHIGRNARPEGSPLKIGC